MNEQHSLLAVEASGAHSPTQQQWTHNLDTMHDSASPEHSADYEDNSAKHSTDVDYGANTGSMSSATDFIKKLYKILSDGSDENVIAWAPQRDRFVVKDIDKFRTSILPRMFKHSNFASFVRQLNKYGFHKVKSVDDEENNWTFQHPEFHADRRYALDNIRRKVPGQRKSSWSASATSESSGSSQKSQVEFLQAEVTSMQTQLASLGTVVGEAISHVQVLQQNRQSALDEMVFLQHEKARQDKLMASLVQQHSRANHEDADHQGSPSFNPRNTAFLLESLTNDSPLEDSGKYATTSRSYTLPRIEDLEAQRGPDGTALQGRRMSGGQEQMRRMAIPDLKEYRESVVSPLSMDLSPGMPGSSSEGWSPDSVTGSKNLSAWPLDGNASVGEMMEESVLPSSSSSGGSSGSSPLTSTMRARRTMFIPRWVVAPHVLLVEDDDVSRKLSAEFLQLSGCTVDFAMDGVEAVNKMTQGKYDLVLMDIGMPQLDGVSATSMIRTFDQQTPIISMTSNTGPAELTTYSSSGMNGIWPKPFNKGVLLDILKKHLTHLTVTERQMTSSMHFNPLATGTPPTSPNDGGLGAIQARGFYSPDSTLDFGAESRSPDPSDGRSNPRPFASDNQFNLKHSRDLNEDDPAGREMKRVDLRE